MWPRLFSLIFVLALVRPAFADDSGIANIGDAIASYRLSAQYCHWPIPANLNAVLNSDEAHFKVKNAQAFAKGAKDGTERFHLLTHSQINYCEEVKESRESMTADLKSRAK